jgi:ribosome-binding protein aMBF1 (putative translation factor)
MSDVEQYINRRKQTDSQFCQGFESGYLSFKLGVILSQAREEAGLTQEELARKLNWDKATVFNLEENVESVGISTLEKYVKALGKELVVEIR